MKVKVTKDTVVVYEGKEYTGGEVIDYKAGDRLEALVSAGHVEKVKEAKKESK